MSRNSIKYKIGTNQLIDCQSSSLHSITMLVLLMILKCYKYIHLTMKSKKRNKSSKREAFDKKILYTIFGIEWLVYLGFCLLAGYFMKDVIEQFQAKETFMGQSLEPINELPTVAICMNNGAWQFDEHLKLIYQIDEADEKHLMTENRSIYIPGEDETVIFQQISQSCLKISSQIDKVVRRGSGRRIYIEFITQMIPDQIKVYFTSETSSYGIFDLEWFDGEPHKEIILSGNKASIILKSVEHSYLQDSECSQISFLEQWKLYLPLTNFSSCTQKCSPWSFLTSERLPFCRWNESIEIIECNREAMKDNYKEFKNISKRPCHILEYFGKKISEGSREKGSIKIGYNFAQPEMTIKYKERLVFDMTGMVGSVGGTLGMCIGFSFTGITSTIFSYIRNKIQSLMTA